MGTGLGKGLGLEVIGGGLGIRGYRFEGLGPFSVSGAAWPAVEEALRFLRCNRDFGLVCAASYRGVPCTRLYLYVSNRAAPAKWVLSA